MSKIPLPAIDKETLLVLTITGGLIVMLIINLTVLLPLVIGVYLPDPPAINETLIDVQKVTEAMKHI